ncbi:hypothetical protein [Rhizobium sp. HT1-10]|uniref:hypothetical protein n=1 Tax=Rhizobium sp. HT1-10 TaxID=3111638 RepID=UPI003C137112
MTSEELGFGSERTSIASIAKLAAITIVACVVFVGVMYSVGKSNAPVAPASTTPAAITQTQ